MPQAIFTKDEATKTMTVVREFNAPRSKVWQAWTTQELLEQWWAPLPWKAVTKSFDFREGGHWHYYMLGPNGEKNWCWAGYETIQPKESFSATDAFCDETGKVNAEMPQMHWTNVFEDHGDTTKVVVTTVFPTVEDMHKVIEMGVEEGFSMGLNQLDEILAKM